MVISPPTHLQNRFSFCHPRIDLQSWKTTNQNLKTRAQESGETVKQKLLSTMRAALKKKKSNQPAHGKITYYDPKQLNNLYTKANAAFGSIANLKNASGLSRERVLNYLQPISPSTKYQQFRKKFPRLIVISYRINETWSIDLAYIDKFAEYNKGFKHLLVAVDVLSCYLHEPIKGKIATDCVEAFKKMIKSKQQEKM